jgi:hypothetical protein
VAAAPFSAASSLPLHLNAFFLPIVPPSPAAPGPARVQAPGPRAACCRAGPGHPPQCGGGLRG